MGFAPRILVVMAVLAAAGGAHADRSPEIKHAKQLYDEGLKHYNVGEYREALQSFKDAYFIKPDPTLLFNMAQSYRQLGDSESAARQYRTYLREVPNAPNRAEVERLIASAEEQARQKAANAPPSGVIAP